MWKFIYQLINQQLLSDPLWRCKTYRIKFILRSLTIPRVSKQWLTYLANYPLRDNILAGQPSLPCRLTRPYLTKHMSKWQQYHALRDHYDFVQTLPTSFNQLFYSQKKYQLASVEGKDQQVFQLILSVEDQLNREGELTISMATSQGVTLARLTFIIMFYQQKQTLFIGGLQGANPQVEHQIIQQATKACFGLFPKRLVIETARYFCQLYNIQQIIAVGNKAHMYQHWRYQFKKRHVVADYDTFWQSLGGELLANDYYHIPVESCRRPIEDIATKKRAEYRRRYNLLDCLQQQMQENFEKFK